VCVRVCVRVRVHVGVRVRMFVCVREGPCNFGYLPRNRSLRSLLQKRHIKETIKETSERYGVALVSRIDKIIGLFCKGAL